MIKQYSLIFVQVIVTGILARGLPPDLRASEHCEWTPFFSLIISESYFKIFTKYCIQHVILFGGSAYYCDYY